MQKENASYPATSNLRQLLPNASVAGYYHCHPNPQPQCHQDLINRHALCLTRIRECASEVESLRRENLALRSINRDLMNRHFHRLSTSTQFNRFTAEEEQEEEEEENVQPEEEEQEESPRSAMKENINDAVPTERVALPKSISVRSNGYLRMMSDKSRTRNMTRPSPPPHPPPTSSSPLSVPQTVYVRGAKKEEEPLELVVYNQGMFKTELCNKWQQTGACPYGDNCQFAHGIEELRPVIRHPRYKTEVCRMVLAGDICPYGHRCHFRHALTEQERLMGPSCSKAGRAINHDR